VTQLQIPLDADSSLPEVNNSALSMTDGLSGELNHFVAMIKPLEMGVNSQWGNTFFP
jgi:hypothetical protein